ncbi:TetR/AcrR family transcriptional regulator [Paenibacillus sp. N3.4]|uniref:TetR/AcrR family transcriptional regulator n=1 Tax=Paenibacillus sp. N3.4 TaxID=2603222 RepID=UPI0011C9A175|nr:TetR/AcrR family transcriptional regulator [Paenibacillus sp. N3.4]TXK79848.1 helix-turn-helix transcriptional regulator [Paenibacillus sp. N3.4]
MEKGIKDAALQFFAIHGYEGASLSQIAENVGMRKQSLYAHFKGKDDLFLQVLQDAKVIMADATFIPTLSFLGVVDSIMLELVYGNNEKRLNDKLNASWTVFWRGISQL